MSGSDEPNVLRLELGEQFLLDRIHGSGRASERVGSGQDPAAASDFRVLLERLEEMARGPRDPVTPQQGGPEDASTGEPAIDAGGLDGLQRDLARADDEFLAVMQVRQRLEAAYRGMST